MTTRDCISCEPDALQLRLQAAEERAGLAERRLQSVLDALPEGVVVLDAEGRYITWNARYAEIYHQSADLFSRGALLMDTLREGVERGDYPESVGREEAWLEERRASLFAANSRFEQRLSDGSCLLVEDRRTAEGDIVGLRVDVTEMKAQAAALADAAAAAEASNQAKSAFLATISHEIRTPLNGVLGMAQAMEAEPLEDCQRRRLRVIRQSGESLLALLNDVLDFSKIEAGRLTVEQIEFDLDELLSALGATFGPLASKKGLGLRFANNAHDGRYLGDPLRLRQILANLISNAIKFTSHGDVQVNVDQIADDLVVSVVDTGIGIAAEHLPRLFSKFDQLDSSKTRQFGGTGLGLAICKELACLMGGRISVESRLGHGTAFMVRLPLPASGAPKPPPATPAPLGASASRMRVLAAEDNSVNRLVLRTLLEQLGAEVVIVSDGLAAIEAWQEGSWDAVLMDVQMPTMDGLEATRRIRALESAQGLDATPIIALSANAMSHHVNEYRGAGFDDFVAKPIVVAQLVSALDRAASQGALTSTASSPAGG